MSAFLTVHIIPVFTAPISHAKFIAAGGYLCPGVRMCASGRGRGHLHMVPSLLCSEAIYYVESTDAQIYSPNKLPADKLHQAMEASGSKRSNPGNQPGKSWNSEAICIVMAATDAFPSRPSHAR
jgi:hypothetical protein